MAQQPPHMGGVVAHPGDAPDDLGDVVKGPQVAVEAVGLGPLQQGLLSLLEVGVGHPGGAARCATALQAGGAVGLPALVPAADGLAGDAQGAGDLGLVDVLGEQFGGVQAAFLQRLPVPAFGGWFAAGRHRLVLLPRHLHVTLHRKTL